MLTAYRLLDICHNGDSLLRLHDLQNCSRIWQAKPLDLPQHLLPGRIGVGYGHQGLRYRPQTYLCGQQPIHSCLNLCFHDHHGGLHLDTDELLQQGTEPVPYKYVRPSPLPGSVAHFERPRIPNHLRSVNPLYYVTFTTATLCASFILYSGFNTTDPINTLSLLCGFLVTFTGVYLLNLSRSDPNGFKMISGRGGDDSVGTDMISQIQTRMSMEARRSLGHNGDREGLMRAYDEEEAAEFGLTDLAEDSDDERGGMRTKQNGSASANGRSRSSEMQQPKSGER